MLPVLRSGKAYRDKKYVVKHKYYALKFYRIACVLKKGCIFATEFISHLRKGNRKTQASKFCVFCFFRPHRSISFCVFSSFYFLLRLCPLKDMLSINNMLCCPAMVQVRLHIFRLYHICKYEYHPVL